MIIYIQGKLTKFKYSEDCDKHVDLHWGHPAYCSAPRSGRTPVTLNTLIGIKQRFRELECNVLLQSERKLS